MDTTTNGALRKEFRYDRLQKGVGLISYRSGAVGQHFPCRHIAVFAEETTT